MTSPLLARSVRDVRSGKLSRLSSPNTHDEALLRLLSHLGERPVLLEDTVAEHLNQQVFTCGSFAIAQRREFAALPHQLQAALLGLLALVRDRVLEDRPRLAVDDRLATLEGARLCVAVHALQQSAARAEYDVRDRPLVLRQLQSFKPLADDTAYYKTAMFADDATDHSFEPLSAPANTSLPTKGAAP